MLYVTQLYAGDGGVVFAPRIDWLQGRFTSIGAESKPGLSLVSPNYVALNRHILTVKFANVKTERAVDASGKYFLFNSRLNNADILYPQGISIEQYIRLKSNSDWRNSLTQAALTKPTQAKAGAEKIELLGADIAGQRVSLQVSGNVNINGRLQNQQRSQVRSGFREGQTTSFVIDQKQQLMIEGKVGDRISILVDQDSERDFDWENNLRIIYTGKEDDIVQKVEAGNVALSLPGTQFVTFSGKNNGLFGLKSLMKFGGVNVTAIASVEKGKKEKLSIEGGAQSNTTTIKDYEYRRNLYFFLDYDFRSRMYSNFKQTGRFTFDPDRVVTKLEVYKSQIYETAGCLRGKAFIDPRNPQVDPELAEQRIFKRLELGKDYYADLNLGFIRLNTQVQDNEVIGVAYCLIDSKGDTLPGEKYGDYNRQPNDTSIIKLKLIKPQYMVPGHPCWDLEFKNVYSLGATGINEDGFDLKIIYNHGTYEDNDRDLDDGKTYLQKFGLDTQDKNGNPTPDDVVDVQNKAIINLGLGELWFPFLRPFQYGPDDESGERNPNLAEKYNCSAMYDTSRSNFSAINEDSKFKIIVTSKSRSSTINLGAMVIENSEIVTLNNQPLQRGIDYTIDYFSGILTLLKPEATTPDAQLDVKYEKNQFFQLDKKTILGARAEYPLGENSFIGATALYFSQSVIDEKVDVGYEPMRNFVWDINGKFGRKLDFLTRAIDWLPLIRSDAPSSFDFEGEIAQVLPNPNTLSNDATGDPNGVGFLDDFEGSKRITSPPIMRRYWSLAAPPKGKDVNSRGFTFWYNPFNGVPTTSIWPNKQVSTRAQNNITEVLVLAVDPHWSIKVGDGEILPQEAWGGITYYFPTSYYDQSTTKYFEIWVWGKSGRMHIDLGQISEDQNGDGFLNTEDKPEAGYTLGNDLLDKNEDTGLDGVFDEDEFIVVNNGRDTLRFGDQRLKDYHRDPSDPHSDNWKWREGSGDYRYINGTEGNSKDVNGLFPDNEDLNNNYVLDPIEDYYTVDFDLDDEIDTRYLAGRTLTSGNKPTGWKLYRIPLIDFSKNNTGKDINWQNIRACRIWMDGMSEQDSVWIAKIEMVGNEWKELGIAANDTATFVRKEADFSVSVINTEDNPDIYNAPKGVEGEYDRINEIRSKEQSLVLWFNGPEGLKSGELCGVKKPLIEEASFITYRRMKLFVYGNNLRYGATSLTSTDTNSPLQFFIRFGKLEESATQHYYELRQPIFPGWDKRNKVEIDLDFITHLKSYNSEDEYPNEGQLKEFFITKKDGQIVKRHYREVKNGQYTGREIIIVNNPSLARISRIDMGIKNRSDDTLANLPSEMQNVPVFGEVWLDELRLSEVRQDKGTAYRSKFSLKMADLATLDVQLSQRDADFHTVEQRPALKPDGLKTTRNLQVNSSFALDKFTPSTWGLRIPVRGSYSEVVDKSKYIPGSDILMGPNLIDTLIDVSHSYSLGASFEKRAGDYWLTKYTIDQLKLNFSASWTERSNKDIRQARGTIYRGTVSYSIPFGRENYIQPLKLMDGIPLIGEKFSKTRWYYTPSNLDVGLDLAEENSSTVRRWGNNPAPTHTFGMDRTLNLGYKVFDNLNVTVAYNSRHNLNEYISDKSRIFEKLNPGKIVDVKESYSMTYSPKIFSWFTPSISYTSNYLWNEPFPSPTKSVDRISNQNRISTSFSLDPVTIFNSFFKTGKPAQQTAPQPATGRRRLTTPDQPPALEPAKKTTQEVKFRDVVANLLKKIQALNFNFSVNNTVQNLGRVGTPNWLYHIGLQSDPRLPLVTNEVAANNKDNTSQSIEFSVRSGLSLLPGVNIPLNFAQSLAFTNSQGQIGKNLTRDFLPLGVDGKKGFPFPGWSINWSGLEKNKFLSQYVKRLSLDHGFQGKETVLWQNGVEKNSSYSFLLQPLIGANLQFKNDLNSTARYSIVHKINNISGATSVVDEQSITGNITYQKAGGIEIPLPFLKNKRLENNINFAMNFDYTTSRTRDRANQASKKFAVRREDKSWKIEPRVNYSFTKKVTGGLFFQYGESFNRQTGKRITRNYGFDVNIAIRG